MRKLIVIAATLAVMLVATDGALPAPADNHPASGHSREPFTPPVMQPPGTMPEGAVRDRVIWTMPRHARVAQRAANTYFDQHGHQIRIEVSDGYEPSPAADQALVDFLGSLLHGDEMNRLYVYVATPEEMDDRCGGDAAACYFPRANLMVIVGEDEFGGFPTDYVAAHEYGHHVANHRRNDPWPAIAWGPKHWATWEGVCPLTRAGKYFPGNQGRHYFRNPGEAFAEAYAKYHPDYRSFPWDWHRGLEPNQGSYERIRRDVQSPWLGNKRTRYTFRVRRGRLVTRTFRTPLDGRLIVVLRGPRRADFDLYLRRPNGRIIRRSVSRNSRERIRHTICGPARFKFTVVAHRGAGRARVTVSKP